MIASNQKTSLLVPSQLPEFIRDNPDYSNFVSFIQAYYEWMEQNGNVTDRSKNILNYTDVDKTTDEFLNYFINEFLPYFPSDALVNKETAVKFAKQIYESKGTPASYQFLFRTLYNCDFDLFYTKDAVLKASDGIWYVSKSLKLASSDLNFLNTQNLRLYGSDSKSIATIENAILNGNKIEVFISNIQRLFLSGEFVTVVDNNNQEVLFDGLPLRAKIVGQINQIIIDPKNRGLLYRPGDPVIVYGGLNSANGIGAIAEVGSTTAGSVQRVAVNNGGFGFTSNSQIIFGPTGEGSAQPTAIVGSLNPTLLPNIIITNGGYGYRTNDSVFANNNLFATVTSVDANGKILQITYNAGIDANSVLGLTANVESANPSASGADVSIASQPGNGTAVVSFIPNDSIFLSQNVPIGNTQYSFFQENPNANANTTLSNTFSFLSLTTYPIGSVLVTNGGGGITQVPTVDAITTLEDVVGETFELSKLGILAPIQIISGGQGYVANDVINLTGGLGVGAYAKVSAVDASGSIIETQYYSDGSYPPGGMGYTNSTLPTVTVESSNVYATGASLYVPCILGTGASLQASVDRAGSVTTIRILNYGEDYIAAPNVSLKVADVLVKGLYANNLPIRGDTIYQGDSISVSGYNATIDSFEIMSLNDNEIETIYSIRTYNYSQSPDQNLQLKIERPGTSEENDIYCDFVPVNYSANTFFVGSPEFKNGVKIYGDSSARAVSTFLNGLTYGEGQYLNTQGQLSSFSVLQNEIYNNFTYQITVEKEIEKYREILLNLLHPTGLKVIGRYALKSNAEFSNTVVQSFTQGYPLYHYTQYVASTATMKTDFENKSTNIIKFNEIGNDVNIANFISTNSILQITTTNGPDVRSEVISIDVASNSITVATNTWLTFSNVAQVTAEANSNTINIRSLTGNYDIINNGLYSNTQYPLKDIVFAGDKILIANNDVKTVLSVDYENDIIYTTNNITSNANSLMSVNRTFVAGGTTQNIGQVIILGTVGIQYVPQLTDESGNTLLTEDGRIILLG